MQIEIDDSVVSELAYMVRLQNEFGAPAVMPDVQSLVRYVLCSIADGSRRPGAWERGLLESLGLVADTGLHQYYRHEYGDPFPPRIVSPDMDIQVVRDHFDLLDELEDETREVLRLLLDVYGWNGRDLHALSSETCAHIVDQAFERLDSGWVGEQ